MSDEKETRKAGKAQSETADPSTAADSPLTTEATATDLRPIRGEVLSTLQAQAPTIVLDSGQLRAQQAQQAMTEAKDLRLDYAPKGGRFKVGDQWVDADGKPVKS